MKDIFQNTKLHNLRCGSFIKIRLLPEHIQYKMIGSKQTPEHRRDSYYTGIILRRVTGKKEKVLSYHILVTSGPMKGHHIVADYLSENWNKAILLPALGLGKAEKYFRQSFGFHEVALLSGFHYLSTKDEECNNSLAMTHLDIIHHVNQAIRFCATPMKKKGN